MCENLGMQNFSHLVQGEQLKIGGRMQAVEKMCCQKKTGHISETARGTEGYYK